VVNNLVIREELENRGTCKTNRGLDKTVVKRLDCLLVGRCDKTYSLRFFGEVMKIRKGSLVRWSDRWIANKQGEEDEWSGRGVKTVKEWREMVGVAFFQWSQGWEVHWSDGEKRRVHRDYLQVI
jgi:hypothetical protein